MATLKTPSLKLAHDVPGGMGTALENPGTKTAKRVKW